MFPDFFVDYATVLKRIADIHPQEYARSRNHLSGSVTYLSPFVTHGIVGTKTIAESVLSKHSVSQSEKLLSELAWREYFHRVWQTNGDDIFSDLNQAQDKVRSDQLPQAIANAKTGISVLDDTLSVLETYGYMHNHARLWVAAVSCNIAHTHWYKPAQWLYYHLLDGDLASNTLSWQWVAGSFSHKKYIANQDNLNRYSGAEQYSTFLDVSYEELTHLDTPAVLQPRVELELGNTFPDSTVMPVHSSTDPVLLYSIWNLDPQWRQDEQCLRILWIDPAMHSEFALSPLRWQFIKHWANEINGLGIFVGTEQELFPGGTEDIKVYTREYPATAHWPGQRDARDWCYECPTGAITSFSNYWKKVRKSSGVFN